MGTKTKLKTGLTMALLTITAILPAFPQVVNALTRQWVQRYDGPDLRCAGMAKKIRWPGQVA